MAGLVAAGYHIDYDHFHDKVSGPRWLVGRSCWANIMLL
jgi:hypothetical protein